MADFISAFNSIPANVKFVPHGRDPSLGLDCLGFGLALYARAGLSVDELDEPYSRRDEARPCRLARILLLLEKKFVRIDKTVPHECREGDVLVVGDAKQNHLAFVVDGYATEMTGKGLRVSKLGRAWPFVMGVWRHKTLSRRQKTA